ncbi:MAG: C40 family peptidase [Oscillospiraceae bacterium]|nr:C40 family peptidase [Oscillospiraceae bacterium]
MAERRKAVEAVRASNRTAASTVRDTAQNAMSGIRKAINAARELAGGITAGGGMVVVIVLVIFLAGLLIASPFGLFFSGEDHGTGYSMPEAVAQLNGEFTARIEQIKAEIPHDTLDWDSTVASSMISNWNNVLAVYAVYVAADETDPHDVAMLTEETFSVLQDIFWEMNEISYFTETIPHTEMVTNENGEEEETTTTETILHITVTVKDYQQMVDEYGFTDEQKELLEELLRPEYQELFQALTGSSQSLTLTPQEVQEIMEHLPDDLSEERRQVVLTAYQLLGKVNYFWGGKSLVLGWDSRWGTPKEVWASGNSSSGTVRPYGLDCSGFVDWVFYNVSNGGYVIGHGGGAAAQHSYCNDISWSEAIPGDLVFYPGDSHVGIVCGFDGDGNVLIIHCASSANNVVVTGKSGFVAVGRPNYYS